MAKERARDNKHKHLAVTGSLILRRAAILGPEMCLTGPLCVHDEDPTRRRAAQTGAPTTHPS